MSTREIGPNLFIIRILLTFLYSLGNNINNIDRNDIHQREWRSNYCLRYQQVRCGCRVDRQEDSTIQIGFDLDKSVGKSACWCVRSLIALLSTMAHSSVPCTMTLNPERNHDLHNVDSCHCHS